MVDSVRSTAEGVEASVIDGLGLRDAVDGALREARASGLPGLGGGPADAYRHLLIAGEIIRRYGPVVGPHLAAMHEFVNDLVQRRKRNVPLFVMPGLDPGIQFRGRRGLQSGLPGHARQ